METLKEGNPFPPKAQTLVASCNPASRRIGPDDESNAVRTADTSCAWVYTVIIKLIHP